MSLVTKCDKCGRIEPSPEGWAMLEPADFQGHSDDLDLCPECYMKVYDFIIGKDDSCHIAMNEPFNRMLDKKSRPTDFNIFEEGDSDRVQTI